MERKQDLTTAYVTVKVNGGVNVLRNIFHFNSEAIGDAFREAFDDVARSEGLTAYCVSQTGASISYAEERAVLTIGLTLEVECNQSSDDFDYSKSLLNVVYSEQFVKELYSSTSLESLIHRSVPLAIYELAEGDESIDYESIETEIVIEPTK